MNLITSRSYYQFTDNNRGQGTMFKYALGIQLTKSRWWQKLKDKQPSPLNKTTKQSWENKERKNKRKKEGKREQRKHPNEGTGRAPPRRRVLTEYRSTRPARRPGVFDARTGAQAHTRKRKPKTNGKSSLIVPPSWALCCDN